MTTILIHLKLPAHYVKSSRLDNASPEELESVLHFADQMLAAKEKYSLEEYTNKKIKEIEQEYKVNINTLENKLKLKQEELSNEKSKADFLISESIKIAKEAIKDESNSHSSFLEKELEEKKKELKELYNENKILQEKLHNKQLSLQNASKRGTIGEVEFHELVSAKRPNWNLIDVHNIPDAMDRLLMYNGIEVRFDVKNHADNVRPDPDIKKFRNNMKLHTETPVGVMIALTATINKKDTFHYEVSPTGQLLLYFPKFNEENMDTIFSVMETIFTIAKLSKANSTQNKDEIKHERLNMLSIDKARNLLEMIRNESATFTKFKKNTIDSFNNHKRHLETQHEFQEELFLKSIKRIENIIQCLSGQEEEISEDREKDLMETTEETPKQSKRKTKANK